MKKIKYASKWFFLSVLHPFFFLFIENRFYPFLFCKGHHSATPVAGSLFMCSAAVRFPHENPFI